jgi:hypothetical protein
MVEKNYPEILAVLLFLTLGVLACGIEQKGAVATHSLPGTSESGLKLNPFALPIIVPNNGQLVRTARAEITSLAWVDLFGTPSLIQSLKVQGLSYGDLVFVRAGTGYTNDFATKAEEKGSRRYKEENRYIVQIAGTIRQDSMSGLGGVVIAKDVSQTNFIQHHGVTVLQGETQISDPNMNVFNFVLRGSVVGGSTPRIAIARKNENSTPLAPGGVPSVFMESGAARTKIDILALSRGWETAFIKTNFQSTRRHVRNTKITRNGRFVGISVPLGSVKAGEIFDASTDISCTAVSDNPQLCTHQIILAESELSDEGEEITIKFGKNVPPRSSSDFSFFGAMTARRNYPYGAFMNVMVKTMSDTSSDGFLRLEKNSTVQFSRYTPR